MGNIKTGDFVKVIKDSANASNFTMLFKECNCKGVYALNNWVAETFQICGEKVRTNFEYEGLSKFAYPLSLNGKLIGFVYDYAIELKPADQIEAHLVEDEIPTFTKEEVKVLCLDWSKEEYYISEAGSKNGFNRYLEFDKWFEKQIFNPTKEEQLTAILGSSEKVSEIMELFKN